MFNVGSFVLASAAMFHILMSIPLALTVWKVVFGQNNIDFLQLVMIFLILCIGADDVFVYAPTAFPRHQPPSLSQRSCLAATVPPPTFLPPPRSPVPSPLSSIPCPFALASDTQLLGHLVL